MGKGTKVNAFWADSRALPSKAKVGEGFAIAPDWNPLELRDVYIAPRPPHVRNEPVSGMATDGIRARSVDRRERRPAPRVQEGTTMCRLALVASIFCLLAAPASAEVSFLFAAAGA